MRIFSFRQHQAVFHRTRFLRYRIAASQVCQLPPAGTNLPQYALSSSVLLFPCNILNKLTCSYLFNLPLTHRASARASAFFFEKFGGYCFCSTFLILPAISSNLSLSSNRSRASSNVNQCPPLPSKTSNFS